VRKGIAVDGQQGAGHGTIHTAVIHVGGGERKRNLPKEPIPEDPELPFGHASDGLPLARGGGLALVIALATISTHAFLARPPARPRRPVAALRYE